MTTSSTKPARRQYTSDFKQTIVTACQKPGASVANIAMQHGINANLVHRWIRALNNTHPNSKAKPAFIALPVSTQQNHNAVIFNLPTAQGDVQVEWPIEQAMQSAQWLKAVLS